MKKISQFLLLEPWLTISYNENLNFYLIYLMASIFKMFILFLLLSLVLAYFVSFLYFIVNSLNILSYEFYEFISFKLGVIILEILQTSYVGRSYKV